MKCTDYFLIIGGKCKVLEMLAEQESKVVEQEQRGQQG